MPELVGFQTMVILDPNGMNFDAVGVFGLVSFNFYLNLASHTVLWYSPFFVVAGVKMASFSSTE